jgi:hypothetical protein
VQFRFAQIKASSRKPALFQRAEGSRVLRLHHAPDPSLRLKTATLMTTPSRIAPENQSRTVTQQSALWRSVSWEW